MRKHKTTNLAIAPVHTPLKLDLACGFSKREGFTGVDRVTGDGIDIVHDLTQPWPWGDDAVDEAHCSHYVEHTPDLMFFMNELWRVLKVGGTCQVIAPYYTSVRAWQDPTHVRAISEMTFMYFNKGWRDQNKLSHYPILADFDFTYGYNIDPAWTLKSEETRQFAMRHYWNVIHDICVTLTKRAPS